MKRRAVRPPIAPRLLRSALGPDYEVLAGAQAQGWCGQGIPKAGAAAPLRKLSGGVLQRAESEGEGEACLFVGVEWREAWVGSKA